MFLKRSSIASSGKGDADGQVGAGAVPLKTVEERRQDKLEKKAAKQKKQEEKEKVEQLEYLKFPNIMGWYFDGTFTKDFTLHEEYAEYFNEIEDEIDAQKDLIIEETFTEKAYRNFWPPAYIGGRYFRTRGVYLDLKEVKEDPPKTPPNINFERQRGVIGVEMDEAHAHDLEHGASFAMFHDTYGPAGHHNNKDNWYWSEQKRDFKPKEPDGDYIWCDDERIWRESDPTYRTPYDWYFDDKQGRYFIRDGTTPELYEFDQERNIYKRVGVKGPSSNGLRHNDYFYDERQRKWLPITKSHGHLKMYSNGLREVVVGDRGKSGLTPDDFYYDGETGKMEQKSETDHNEYFYDTHDKMFKKKNQPYGPGKTNLYPSDYEFDLKLGKYHPKPAKECRHIEPYDWYFDMDTGKFYRIDRSHLDKYVYDPDRNVYKLKDAKGPSANELGPNDYFWDENSREWKLCITLKDQSVLEHHDPGKRKFLKGDRGKSGKVPDDFYYDAYDGSFFRKDTRKLDMYWYDTVDEVWKKRGQHYGPGYFQLYPHHYYFDYDEGFWFPTATAKQILAKQRRGEVKGLSDRTPYDYFFNDSEGDFQLRDKFNPRWYKYNPKTGVFHKEGVKGPSPNGKSPKDFFFDEFTCTWLPLEHPKGHEARDYKFGKRNNRNGPRGRSGKIPDDFYYSFVDGQFHQKDPNDTETEYEYLPDLGVWKHPKEPGPSKPDPKIPELSDYYFDKEEGQFILKKKLEYGEINLNPNTNLWMQRWRCPKDYYWESRQNKYLRKPAAMIQKEDKAKNPVVAAAIAEETRELEQAQKEKEKRDRDYERPWLHNYLELAADEIRFEQELLKQTTRSNKNSKKKPGLKVPAKVPEKMEEPVSTRGSGRLSDFNEKDKEETQINESDTKPEATAEIAPGPRVTIQETKSVPEETPSKKKKKQKDNKEKGKGKNK